LGFNTWVRELSKCLTNVREWSKCLRDVAIEKFVRTDSIILVSLSRYRSALYPSYLAFKSLTKVRVEYVDPDTLIYFIGPYRELMPKVLLYFDGEARRLGRLLRVIDTLNMLRTNYTLITPKIPEQFIKRARGDVIQTSEGVDPLIAINYLLLDSITTSRNTCLAEKRCGRLSEELKDMPSLINDFLSYYGVRLSTLINSLKELVGTGSVVALVSTPSLRIVSEVLSDYLSRCKIVPLSINYSINVMPIQGRIAKIITLVTDVEDAYVKELVPPIMVKVPIHELRIRTDPLTAPIYGLLLTKVITGSLSS